MYLVGCTFLSFSRLKVALWVASRRGQGNLDTSVAADEDCFLLEEGDLAGWVEAEAVAPFSLEVVVLGVLGIGSEGGVAGGSLRFMGGRADAMGQVFLDRILLL